MSFPRNEHEGDERITTVEELPIINNQALRIPSTVVSSWSAGG